VDFGLVLRRPIEITRLIGHNLRLPARFLDGSLGIRYIGLRPMKRDLNSFLPLSAASLHILLSLAADDLHGYGIMQEVLRQSEGQYKLGPGTLYDNLQKLIEHSFVLELGHRSDDDDPRRRYYRLSTKGRAVLSAEIVRLERVIREGKSRLQSLRPRKA
jgi:DNA-binding PadR family transcriptional regulator